MRWPGCDQAIQEVEDNNGDEYQDQAQVLQARVSPRLIAANHILEMSSQELQDAINSELDENPALDMVDVRPVPPVDSRRG